MLMLACDTALSVYLLVHLLRHPHTEISYLRTRNILAHGCAVVCPLVVLILVLLGMPDGLLVFALTKMFMFLAVVGNYLGMGLAGERPDARIYAALAIWHVLALVSAVVYWRVRSRSESD